MSPNSGRRRFLKGTGAVGTIALAGCISSTDNGGDDTDTPTEETDSMETESGDGTETETETDDGSNAGADVNIGMVYATGGLGDKSFNDMARQGALQAEEELGISFDQAQPEQNSDFSPAQRNFAESGDYDLISCIGFAQTDALTENADRYSDQHFQIVDSTIDSNNVASYVFREHEGSFQVGHLAGLLTSQSFEAGQGSTSSDSTSVGFVGGLDVPLIRKFQAGFEAGAQYANEDIDIQTSYVGSFNDAATAREAALSMYDSGADIVYHAAGASGLGVFQAAQERGKFAMGVDADQSRSEPDFADWILASMVKRVDTAVYTAIENEVDEEFNGGSVTTLGLESDGVACVYGDALGDAIPQDVKDQIAASRQAIIDGEITVPTEP